MIQAFLSVCLSVCLFVCLSCLWLQWSPSMSGTALTPGHCFVVNAKLTHRWLFPIPSRTPCHRSSNKHLHGFLLARSRIKCWGRDLRLAGKMIWTWMWRIWGAAESVWLEEGGEDIDVSEDIGRGNLDKVGQTMHDYISHSIDKGDQNIWLCRDSRKKDNVVFPERTHPTLSWSPCDGDWLKMNLKNPA